MSKKRLFQLIGLFVVLSLVLVACETEEPAEPEEPEEPEEPVEEEVDEVTLAIMHFSVIEGTTWSQAQHRAGERIAEKYDEVDYVYREEVGPDLSVPYAEDMIDEGADIVVGNAEFMGLPLKDIADQYPDVYFAAVVGSDVTTEQNFIRYFPRQYQALYLEGLVAGALTETNNIGIVSAFPVGQTCRRQAGFVLGVQEAAEILGKDIDVYVRYSGDWYLPAEEKEIATTLVDEYDVDVITQQTDSGSPLDVAEEEDIWFVGKDMDTVGYYGWSDTDTVAISFDTRWEVLFEQMVEDKLAGNSNPENIVFLGMESTMELADGREVLTVDIKNDDEIGVDAISPEALPLIEEEIVDLIEQRREQMIAGEWDPFTEFELVSNGTGVDLEGLPVPEEGEVVKPAGEEPSAEWLLGSFNFDLEGMTILE
ncbi:MAG: BMP family ABC transporter substrate-binding protein [Bacillota bacterium]